MSETIRLRLPLVQAGQAQKHVTVNSALQRLDAVSQLVLRSRSVAAPTASEEGDCYAVPASATGDWAGQSGRLAIFANGGWDFLDPAAGWRAWVADEGVQAVHDGAGWSEGAQSVSPSGAAFSHRVVEIDHDVTGGAFSTTSAVIPSGAIVFGVTGRVLNALGGAATSFRLGIAGVSDDRYGSGIGVTTGSWLRGITAAPVAYYADTALTLTGEGGSFGSGSVRLAVHLAELSLPGA